MASKTGVLLTGLLDSFIESAVVMPAKDSLSLCVGEPEPLVAVVPTARASPDVAGPVLGRMVPEVLNVLDESQLMLAVPRYGRWLRWSACAAFEDVPEPVLHFSSSLSSISAYTEGLASTVL